MRISLPLLATLAIAAGIAVMILSPAYAQFPMPQGEPAQEPQPQPREEGQKSSIELNREALEILEKNPSLTPTQKNQIEFLKKSIEAQEALQREHPEIFGSSPSSEAPTAPPTTDTESNTTKTIVVSEEVVREIEAAVMSIGESTPRITGYIIKADIATQNNDTQKVRETLDLISEELENMRGNLTRIKLPPMS